MPFEARVRDLSERLTHCEDEVLSLKLAEELHGVLHEEIERLRDKVAGMPLLDGRRTNKRGSPTGSGDSAARLLHRSDES
jgi:hypothetical protein